MSRMEVASQVSSASSATMTVEPAGSVMNSAMLVMKSLPQAFPDVTEVTM